MDPHEKQIAHEKPDPNPNHSDTQEKKIAHEKLAEETEDVFQEPSKLGVKLSPEFLESCYTPIIQSGGKFDLKPSAFSNGDNLYYGAAAPRPPPTTLCPLARPACCSRPRPTLPPARLRPTLGPTRRRLTRRRLTRAFAP